MNIQEYLDRIKYKGELSVDADCLRQLHTAHLMTVPFEALDIHLKRKISLDLSDIYNKVVEVNRGGFCYELNYLFCNLLKSIGFDCYMISSRLHNKGVIGPEHDHVSIIIELEELWLADVAHGDLFIEPLRVTTDEIQEGVFKLHRIIQVTPNEFLLLESLKDKIEFKEKYSFNLKPKEIEEFSVQCVFKETSTESHFVKNVICTMPTPRGRKTIFNNIYRVEDNAHVDECPITDNQSLMSILQREFNIDIPYPPKANIYL